jgi:hypothetical protein
MRTPLMRLMLISTLKKLDLKIVNIPYFNSYLVLKETLLIKTIENLPIELRSKAKSVEE